MTLFGFPGRSMRGQNEVASRDAVFVADTRNGRVVAAFDVRTLQPEYTFGYLGRATGVTESPMEPQVLQVYVPQVFAWVLVVAQFLEAGGQSTTDSKGENHTVLT